MAILKLFTKTILVFIEQKKNASFAIQTFVLQNLYREQYHI